MQSSRRFAGSWLLTINDAHREGLDVEATICQQELTLESNSEEWEPTGNSTYPARKEPVIAPPPLDSLERAVDEVASSPAAVLASLDSSKCIRAGRRFEGTQSKHMASIGWLHVHAEIGDKVCVFHSGPLAYIVHPQDNGLYTFVGDCYLHGAMHGEALDMEDLEDQEFVLV
jgi:hypothetical protein